MRWTPVDRHTPSAPGAGGREAYRHQPPYTDAARLYLCRGAGSGHRPPPRGASFPKGGRFSAGSGGRAAHRKFVSGSAMGSSRST